MNTYDLKSSNAFIQQLAIKPYQSGMLDQLKFAVKDLIDVAGYVTGAGNPTWVATHPKASANAVCIEQLLSAGAACIGKTITDELAYSLIGENHFYGSPLNPRAAGRVTGGSSSGSASAVACNLVDFALGTDTGGSVRVPASFCGIYGYRPSYGRITLAGVNPLAPSFDTVGILSKEIKILQRVMQCLLGEDETPEQSIHNVQLYWLEDIAKLCEPAIQAKAAEFIKKLTQMFSVKQVSLKQLFSFRELNEQWLLENFSILQSAEVWSTLGAWVEAYANESTFGENTRFNLYQIAKKLNRSKIQNAIINRNYFITTVQKFFQSESCMLCFPTTPMLAPPLGSITPESRTEGVYYPRMIAFNAIAGLAKCPQISLPLLEIDGLPCGISIVAQHGNDKHLIQVAEQMCVRELQTNS